jgi:membrane protease YdiL (CAAX protease family)
MFMFGGVSLASFFGFLIAQFVLGVPLLSNPALAEDLLNPTLLPVLRLLQILQALGLIIVPSLGFLYLSSSERGFGVFGNPIRQRIMLSIVLFMVAMPFINFLGDWNAHIQLPEPFGTWVTQKETQTEKLIERFLQMPHLGWLAFNLFMIALLPALGEELLFRGVAQRLLANWSGNAHVAVWTAAILFSAIHMQFLGFVPRLFMGAALGYLFLWSGNLWYPIIAHFANNAMAVVIVYMQQHGSSQTTLDTAGIQNPAMAAFSLAFCLMLMYLFKVVQGSSSNSDSFRE